MSDVYIPFLRKDNGGRLYFGFGREKCGCLSGIAREKNDGLGGDGEMIINHCAASVGKNVGVCAIGKCVYVSRHRGKVGIESAASVLVLCKKKEVFSGVPEGNDHKRRSNKEKRSEFHSGLLADDPLSEPEKRHRRNEKDEGNGADSTEGMRKSFFGQEFRDEHGGEAAQEKESYE